MKHRRQGFSGRSRTVAAALLVQGLCLGLGSGRADDRLLLRQSPAPPYMFILLDTSGSMNEKPADSSSPIGSGDDPESKFYQAKSALYTALGNNPDVQYGFATFNQDQTLVRRKHWIYTPAANPGWSSSPSALGYPVRGVPYVFGGEDTPGANTTVGGCTSMVAIANGGFDARTQFTPRLGDLGTNTWTIWLRPTTAPSSLKGFKVTTQKIAGNLGDPTITVRVVRSVVGSCPATFTVTETKDVTFNLVRQTYARTSYAADIPLGPASGPGTGVLESCSGMDANSDSMVDRYKLATTINPLYPTNTKFDRGDFLPFDWGASNRDEILRRLAPNLRGSETVPDFGQARYIQYLTQTATAPFGSVANPPLVDPLQVPLLAQGNTPLGNSMSQFRDWYAGCHDDDAMNATCSTPGWAGVAKADDQFFDCRGKYLLILTDGLDTCGGDGELGPACQGAKVLYEKYGITTIVLAFGQVSIGGSVLSCLADKGSGGTIRPFNPTDQVGLAKALQTIFERVTQTSRSFSSAAVPTVQANFEDTVYVPNFTSLNPTSFVEPHLEDGLGNRLPTPAPGAGATWDGHLSAFLKPVPLDAAGKPSTQTLCSATPGVGVRSQCFLWDAGVKILEQAPSFVQLQGGSPTWMIGAGDNERRLFYAKAASTAAVPAGRRLLLPQTTLADQQDLWEGMGLLGVNTSDSFAVDTANSLVEGAIKYTLGEKQAVVDASRTATFVLGDIFHSNPVLLSAPNRIAYYDNDVPNPPGISTPCTSNKGYRCFRQKHQYRRRVAAVGSNDGEMHLFDAGIYRTSLTPKSFDNGTGKEVMAFVPRPMLKHLYGQASTYSQNWGVDGTIQVDDVFMDPSHTGTPTATDREWRTVLIGSLREGGNGYFTLDVTQPDVLNTSSVPQPLGGGYVPSCWNGGSNCGPVPFGSVLWSFSDASDEDNNEDNDSDETGDLGDTWSTPNTGRIRILVDGTATPKVYEDHYVAIFGGGMDPSRQNKRGNWLYMVDIETGLVIYKRQLDGSAPSDPAAIDTDLDGYLDRVYIGTTKGWVYKVDMSKDVQLVVDGSGRKRITSAAWAPVKVFDTATDRGTATEKIRPVFFPPSVVFDAKSGQFALGFGTGNREDLWSDPNKMGEALIEGRFYFVLDTGWHAQGATELPSVNTTLPKTGADFVQISLDTAVASAGTNFLSLPPIGSQAGWTMLLSANERLISKALTLSGISVFTGFVPSLQSIGGGRCERNGTSNIYTVLATNANPVLGTDPENRRRVIKSFVTNPFVETNISKNKRPPTSDPPQTGAVCQPSAEAKNVLRSLFPGDCKFTEYTQDIKTFQVNTELVCIAAIPVCVREQNWRDQ
ncbi:MAG: hypothetical protein ABJC13_12765 [Acidobacteriota bacterium]